jgi:hypothetical protein
MRPLGKSGLYVAALAVLLWMAPPAFAQARTREVRGRVTDQGELSLPGAVVQIMNSGSLRIRSYITQADGSYLFRRLSLDRDYELKAIYRGKSSSVRRLSRFDSKKVTTIDLQVDLRE